MQYDWINGGKSGKTVCLTVAILLNIRYAVIAKRCSMNGYESRFLTRKDELEYLYRELYHDRWYLDQLEGEMKAFSDTRPSSLSALDLRREGEGEWYLDQKALGLTLYTQLFASSLKGIEKKIPYLKELGITYLHLMPILKMPKRDNDGGYAVEDFNTVDPTVGSNADLDALTEKLRVAGISLCLDFVMNHTSSSHEWAQRAENGEMEYQLRYLCYDDRRIPDQFEMTVPEVFPSTAPGNFTWNEKMRKWVFTSFYPTQWDLNYANPVVLNEMIYSMLRLANRGVEIFRIDAVPYIWKRLGTNCRNLKEVHTIVRIIRLVLECVAPAVILKGEVVMAPHELSAYFGTPEKPECHILYNVSVMVNLWSALASQDARLLRYQVEDLLSLPMGKHFLNYLRCHDDIGWGLDEMRERQLGMDPLGHKIFLYRFYSGAFPGSYARGELYNYDPVSLDARSTGTQASLEGFESAANDEERAKAMKRYVLMNATMYALGGFPMFSSGDEIGQLNDYSYKNDPLLRDDSRNLHRSAFNWKNAALRKRKGTKEYEIWHFLARLKALKASLPCFNGNASISTWDPHNDRVFALKREFGGDDMLICSNFSDREEHVSFAYYTKSYRDAFTGKVYQPGLGFTLDALEVLYLVPLA